MHSFNHPSIHLFSHPSIHPPDYPQIHASLHTLLHCRFTIIVGDVVDDHNFVIAVQMPTDTSKGAIEQIHCKWRSGTSVCSYMTRLQALAASDQHQRRYAQLNNDCHTCRKRKKAEDRRRMHHTCICLAQPKCIWCRPRTLNRSIICPF